MMRRATAGMRRAVRRLLHTSYPARRPAGRGRLGFISQPVARGRLRGWRLSARAISTERAQGSLYDYLGIEETSTPTEIRKAYLDLSKKYHPDLSGRDTHETFARINTAYNILSSPAKRADYDYSLSLGIAENAETILSRSESDAGGANYSEEARVSLEKSAFVYVKTGREKKGPYWFFWLLARLGWKQDGPKENHLRSVFVEVMSLLLALFLGWQAKRTVENWRSLDPSVVNTYDLVVEANAGGLDDDSTQVLQSSVGSIVAEAKALYNDGNYAMAADKYREALSLSPDKTDLLDLLREAVVAKQREEALRVRSDDEIDREFGDPNYYVQPWELSDPAARARLQGGVIGAAASVFYHMHLAYRHPISAAHPSAMFVGAIPAVFLMTTVTPVITQYLTIPETRKWDAINGNATLVAEAAGISMGLMCTVLAKGVNSRVMGALVTSSILGRGFGWLAAKPMTGRYWGTSKIPQQPQPSDAEQDDEAASGAQDVGAQGEGVDYRSASPAEETKEEDLSWSKKMKLKAKRLAG